MYINYTTAHTNSMNSENMSLPKLERKHRSLNIVNLDSKLNQNLVNSLSTENVNGLYIASNLNNQQQNDDFKNFPLINTNGADIDTNLSALNYTRNHSYRNNSMKVTDSTRSSKIRKRSSVETLNANINRSTPAVALSPKDALSLYKDHLTDFEKSEILDYPAIYFVGQDVEKLNVQSVKDYSDENGSYRKVRYDHIAYRYEVFETLGSGSFGMVVKCFDHKYKELVAIKIIRNRKKLEQQGMVEVKILNHLKNLDSDEKYNVVHIKEYFYFRNHLCISFELLGMNLYEVIKKNQFQGFTTNLVRKFAYAILQCLRLLFRERIIHCDLKPENILIRQKNKNSTSCSLKICDFGSGTFESEKIYTYIQSRFYRAPEVILGISYSMSIDVWSLGCILAELYTGHPLFPGSSEADQLNRIIEVIGMPPPHILEQSTRAKLFFDAKGFLKETKSARKIKPESRALKDIFKDSDPNFVDFLTRCLEWDPEKRMVPEEALRHSWIVEAKLQKHNSVKREKRPKHRIKRDDTTYGVSNSTRNIPNSNSNDYHSASKRIDNNYDSKNESNYSDDDENDRKVKVYLPPI